MEAAEVEDAVEGEDEDILGRIDVRRYLLALRKYVWLIAALIVLAIAGAVVFTLRQTPIYEAKSSVQIEPRLPDLLGTGDLFNVAAGAGANANEYYRQQRQVLGSVMLLSQTIQQNDLLNKFTSDAERKQLSKDDALDLAARRLQPDVSVKYPEDDRIMYVAVRNSDPVLARDIANDIVSTYDSYAKGLLSLNSTKASDALQAEFDDAEKKLRAAEEKLLKFQSENDMIAITIEEHQQLVNSNILTMTTKLNDERAKQIELVSKLTQMRKEAKQDVLSTPIVMMGDPLSFETLRTTYYTEKIHLLELEKELGAKNPDYLAQKAKVDELFRGLQGQVNILVAGTEDLAAASDATVKGLTTEVEKYELEAQRLSPKIVQYNDLMREKKDIEDQYNILRARLSATQMTGSMSSIISNVRPLDKASTPLKAVSPSMRTNVAIAGIFALLLGIALVVLTVFLDRSIKSPVDASQSAGVPVLGIIPMLGGTEASDDRHRDLYVHDNPTSATAECCRSIRTNIMLSAADRKARTIVVSSANPREGKTTTVMYLGTTIAQSGDGERVLLIDTDMRRPRLHASTGISRERGLANLILGEDDYDGVVKPTEIPNLFILPCGPLPPNPAELLMTRRFETVLAELGKRFSRIILDSPPLPYTDAVVLSKRTDGVILVARAGKTLRDDLKRSAKQIRRVDGAILGVIVNEFNDHEGGAYYYYSYYGSGRPDEKRPSEAA